MADTCHYRNATLHYKNVHELKNGFPIIAIKRMATSLYNSDKYPRFHPSSSPKGWVFFCLQITIDHKKSPSDWGLIQYSIKAVSDKAKPLSGR